MKKDVKKILSNMLSGIESGREKAWLKQQEELTEKLKEAAFELLVHSGGAAKLTIPFNEGTITITATPIQAESMLSERKGDRG